jgi:hypothetical protein
MRVAAPGQPACQPQQRSHSGQPTAEVRSCSSPVLVQEPVEQVTSVDAVSPSLASDAGIGRGARSLQPERPVRCSLSCDLGSDRSLWDHDRRALGSDA